MRRTIRLYAIATSALLSIIALTPNIEAQPGGTPSYRQRLVERFDADENGRLDDAERATALEWIKAERAKNPPRRWREREVPESDLEPYRVSKEEAEKFPRKDLYDTSAIRTIFLDFEDPEWDDNMVLFWRTGIQLPATLTVDGEEYRDVGVHFRGSSSFFGVVNRDKKSLGIAMDWADPEQRLAGYKSLNLLSGHADPSFMRTVLFAHIAGKYVPTPKACFVHLVINGESWGLYINDQQINGDFCAEAFGTRDGARWKVRPNFAGKAALGYQGPEKKHYEGFYDLRSADSEKKAWKRLIELCQTMSETWADDLDERLPRILDVEHALWFLAVDNVLMDGDGYHYRGSDYAIYLHPNGRFYPLFRDNNEAFNFGGGPGGFGRPGQRGRRSDAADLDPLALRGEERAGLCNALLSVPRWRTQYLRNCRLILHEWLDWEKIGPVVEEWREQIEPLVSKDDKALYGYDEFLSGLDQGSERRPGLKKFIDDRRKFLLEHDDLREETF